MDRSIDPKVQHLKKNAALLLRSEEAMVDALAEAAASSRQAGDVAKAARMERFTRQLRVDLLEQRSLIVPMLTRTVEP